MQLNNWVAALATIFISVGTMASEINHPERAYITFERDKSIKTMNDFPSKNGITGHFEWVTSIKKGQRLLAGRVTKVTRVVNGEVSDFSEKLIGEYVAVSASARMRIDKKAITAEVKFFSASDKKTNKALHMQASGVALNHSTKMILQGSEPVKNFDWEYGLTNVKATKKGKDKEQRFQAELYMKNSKGTHIGPVEFIANSNSMASSEPYDIESFTIYIDRAVSAEEQLSTVELEVYQK